MSDLDGMYEALESQWRWLACGVAITALIFGLCAMVVVSGGELGWFLAWCAAVAVWLFVAYRWLRCQRAFSRAERGEG